MSSNLDRWPLLVFIYLGVPAASASAQDRPDESDLFGDLSTSDTQSDARSKQDQLSDQDDFGDFSATTDQSVTTSDPTGDSSVSRDELILGSTHTPISTGEIAPSDPLTVGGQLYLRAQIVALERQNIDDYTLNMPSLLDLYFDARPNERVRGFVLGRVNYDPMLPASRDASNTSEIDLSDVDNSGSASLSSIYATGTSGPRLQLDQLWLRFDIAYALFVTVGRQHVRWGTAHFWSPTDFLHLHRRDPLAVFDDRRGTTMLKVHLPIESLLWNFYAYGVTENQNGEPSLSSAAGAARAEFVVATAELGLGVFGRPYTQPKFAGDLSIGLGDFDLYGEMAVVDGRDNDRVWFIPNADLSPFLAALFQTPPDLTVLPQAVDAIYPVYRVVGYRMQAVAGLSYAISYNDNDLFTIGAEYFYNGFGYVNSELYPGLILPHTNSLNNPARFFYLGKHYAALYLLLPAPFSLDLHSFTLSTLGNISDRSFITRLDYSYTLLTHLRFELFAAAHYGWRTGEFRLGLEPPVVNGTNLGALLPSQAPFLFDLGLALRLSI